MQRFSRVREAKRRSTVLQVPLAVAACGMILQVFGSGCFPRRGSRVALVPPRSERRAPSAAKDLPSRWQLVPKRLNPEKFMQLEDGRRLMLVRGLRLVERPDGSILRSEETFSEGRVRHQSLPRRLGGGYVFFAVNAAYTDIWHAERWSGRLKPLVRFDFAVERIVPGFDKLYATSRGSSEVYVLDPKKASLREVGNLPASPAFGDFAFGDKGLGIVLASLRGALSTVDRGASWKPLEVADEIEALSVSASGRPVVKTQAGHFTLNPYGGLDRTALGGSDFLFKTPRPTSPVEPGKGEEASLRRVAALGPRPLRSALLKGALVDSDTALVVEGSRLGHVRLSDGQVLSTKPFGGVGPCRGEALGQAPALVCGGGNSPTEIYLYERGELRLLHRWPAARTVRANGKGGLVVSGSCSNNPASTVTAAFPVSLRPSPAGSNCIVRQDGSRTDVFVSDPMARVVALRDGSVVALTPPSDAQVGALSILSRSGKETRVKLSLEGSDARTDLARSGTWLLDVHEGEDSRLSSWVVRGGAFASVRVSLTGKVEVGAIQDGAEDTMFEGAHALQVLGLATERETFDFGASWESRRLPAVVQSRIRSVGVPSERGCSPVGCVYEDWGRVNSSLVASEVAPPKPKSRPSGLGYSFWALQCHPAGNVEQGSVLALRSNGQEPPLASSNLKKAPSGRGGRPPESSSWLSLMGRRAPSRSQPSVGYDFGEVNAEGAYRAYVWGPFENSWRGREKWQLSVVDRFSRRTPWSTTVSRGPWKSARLAALHFGLDASAGVDWKLQLSASGEHGLLQIRAQGKLSRFLVERGRTVLPLSGSVSNKIGIVQGVEKLGDDWILGSVEPERVQVHRLSEGRVRLLGEFPRMDRLPVHLVSSADRSRIALWQRTSRGGWYFLPVDLDTGATSLDLHLPRQMLTTMPRPCQENATGWKVVSSVPLTDIGVSESNVSVSLLGGAEAVRTRSLAARLIVNSSGVCVESLAALTKSVIDDELRLVESPPSRHSVPLVVTDPFTEQRWRFRCNG